MTDWSLWLFYHRERESGPSSTIRLNLKKEKVAFGTQHCPESPHPSFFLFPMFSIISSAVDFAVFFFVLLFFVSERGSEHRLCAMSLQSLRVACVYFAESVVGGETLGGGDVVSIHTCFVSCFGYSFIHSFFLVYLTSYTHIFKMRSFVRHALSSWLVRFPPGFKREGWR
jgi:hypothetical protein